MLMLESTPDKPAATAGGELAGWILGIVVSQAIYVATVLGIADLLAGGPRSATALALAADAGPDGLYRLLRLLVGHGIFVELPGGRFANSAHSELLREVPGSLRALAVSVGERDYPALGDGNPGRGGRPRRPAGGDGTHVARFERWARWDPRTWTQMIARRCRALVSDGQDGEQHFRAALAVDGAGELPFELARTGLLYGEWLRRAPARRRPGPPARRPGTV
jgi:hypothetical protein